jgi:hypothetical protein
MPNAIPKQPTKAQVVAFEVLLGEREYQTETHPGQPVPSIVDFANLLIEYTDKLAVDATVDPTSVTPAGGPLKRFREIAAIALHAMEIYGIQPRENHVPASAGITGTINIVGKADAIVPVKSAPMSTSPDTREERTAPPPMTPTDAPAPPHSAPQYDAPPLPPPNAPLHPETLAVAPAAVHNPTASPVLHRTTTEEHGK